MTACIVTSRQRGTPNLPRAQNTSANREETEEVPNIDTERTEAKASFRRIPSFVGASYQTHNVYCGRGGGGSGWGANISSSGAVVWLSSPSSVAMIPRPANERPASAFIAAA